MAAVVIGSPRLKASPNAAVEVPSRLRPWFRRKASPRVAPVVPGSPRLNDSNRLATDVLLNVPAFWARSPKVALARLGRPMPNVSVRATAVFLDKPNPKVSPKALAEERGSASANASARLAVKVRGSGRD